MLVLHVFMGELNLILTKIQFSSPINMKNQQKILNIE